MSHKSLPRDSCGGSKSCGSNLLATGSVEEPESFLRRNVRALSDVISAMKVSRDLSKKES